MYDKAEEERRITDAFIKHERQHTEIVRPHKKPMDYSYRERSIDDGSHFDPRLDKYPQPEHKGTLKRNQEKQGSEEKEKKFGTLKRVSFYRN